MAHRHSAPQKSLMLQSFCHFLFNRVLGWTAEVTVPARDKCLLCVAPHTSNKDFLLGELYIRSIGRKAGFLMKKEWFFWPLGGILRKIGGIAVERSRHTSLTDQLSETAARADYFRHSPTRRDLEARFLLHRAQSRHSHPTFCHRRPTQTRGLHQRTLAVGQH